MTTRPSQNPSHLTPQEIGQPQSPELRCLSLRRSNLCGAKFAFCLLASLLSALSPALVAAPPPEITVLRQQYEKVIAERVTSPFVASKSALDTKFSTALNNAITAAKLDDVLASPPHTPSPLHLPGQSDPPPSQPSERHGPT